MWVTLFGPLGERLIAQAYSQTCPSKVAPARHREEWFGVCDYNLHWWGGAVFSLKSNHTVGLVGGGGRSCQSALIPRERNLGATTVQETLINSKQSSLQCPRLLSDHCAQPVCAWAIRLPSTTVLYLSLVRGWDSKLQI